MIIIGSTQKNAFIGNGDYSPTLTEAMGKGGGQIPMILEAYALNPKRTETTVQKDNYILIKNERY